MLLMTVKPSIACLLLTVLTITVTSSSCEGKVKVTLNKGWPLFGKEERTFFKGKPYYTFKGVPYAEPPVGDLRFKPPVPHKGWADPIEAYENKPTCVQFSSKERNNEPVGISGSEDCLYLNVFTPSIDHNESKAVLVFDYHDDFRTGFNGTKTYSPEFFADEDIVIVTISHRLGLLGYLTTEDDTIPANNGMRDYLLALKWVKDNINEFGGNPDRVTLMGCKGGASLAHMLLYSKQATGLFNSVTMQGGTAFEANYFPQNTRQIAFKLGNLLGVETGDSTELLKELKQLDFKKLYNEGVKIPDDYKKIQMSISPFTPIIETDSPEAVLTTLPENGKIVNDVPVLIGYNSRAGLDIVSHIIYDARLLEEIHHENFLVNFPIRTGFRFDVNSTVFKNFLEEIYAFYFEDGYMHTKNFFEYPVYVGDTLQNYAMNFAARKLSKELKSSTFFYLFDFFGSFNENMINLKKHSIGEIDNWGATVGDEICYLHLCSRIKRTYKEIRELLTETIEVKLLQKMVRMWANFAKTGNPTPTDSDVMLKKLKWHPIDKESEDIKYLHIAKKLRMDINPLGESEKFWDRLLDKYSKMAVDGVVKDEQVKDEL